MRRAPFVLLAALLAGCSPSVNALYVTIESYISAVSLNDTARALALSAPYQRELAAAASADERERLRRRFETLFEQGYMSWETAKASRELSPDPLGVAVIRAIGLGREGAASVPLTARFEQGNQRAIVISRAVTNYDRIPWEALPQGGRMYLMGHPFGKVVNFATGFDDPSKLALLATVDLEWILVKLPGGGPAAARGDWFVESVAARPDTATPWSPPSQAGP